MAEAVARIIAEEKMGISRFYPALSGHLNVSKLDYEQVMGLSATEVAELRLEQKYDYVALFFVQLLSAQPDFFRAVRENYSKEYSRGSEPKLADFLGWGGKVLPGFSRLWLNASILQAT